MSGADICQTGPKAVPARKVMVRCEHYAAAPGNYHDAPYTVMCMGMHQAFHPPRFHLPAVCLLSFAWMDRG